MKENFKITSVEDGKEYWIGRSVAVSAFIFKNINNELHVLTEIRGSGMHDFPGKRCVPCGYINWGETAPEACSREVYEETGLVIDNKDWVLAGVNSNPNANRENISIHYTHFMTDDKDTLSISNDRGGDKNEVEKLEWVPVDDMPMDFCFDHDDFIFEYGNQMKAVSKWFEFLTKGKK